MHRLNIVVILALCLSFNLWAQPAVKGVVLEQTQNGNLRPLVGANIFWIPTLKGTTSDSAGVFTLGFDARGQAIVISYIGYVADTILPDTSRHLRIILAEEKVGKLNEVIIEKSRESNFVSLLDPIHTRIMTEKELTKAACCNLSESFETNPSVDVSFSDGVTGAKQIQMLGLSGIYTQITTENMPSLKGLNTAYGLAYTPGPWISSIQVSKGTGSVANGFESISGQINVELKKPKTNASRGEKLLLNGFINSMGRHEWNLNHNLKINKNLAVATLMHADAINIKNDMNHDGYVDIPLGQQYNIMQRWKFENSNGWIIQWGGRYLKDARWGGEMSAIKGQRTQPEGIFGLGIEAERVEGFAKFGYMFPDKKYKSMGLILQGNTHNQHNYFGKSYYSAHQQGMHANFIYQSIIGNTFHKFRTGITINSDRYRENIEGKIFLYQIPISKFDRVETVAGAFGEYTYTGIDRLTLIAGLRADHHNYFKWFITPRLHGKYDVDETTQLRFSAGRGVRSANVLAEQFSLLINNRVVELQNQHTWGYGLGLEKAWNVGSSLTHQTELFDRKANLTLDYYYTNFQNQIVLDLDRASNTLAIYNLQGPSYAHSSMAEFDFEPIYGLKTRLAYRYYNVRTTYHGKLLERPFVAPHRAFFNAEYKLPAHWQVDYTVTWNASKRLPSTEDIPEALRFPDYSPSFFIMHAQISKTWAKRYEAYAGVENLGNFMQHRLIVDPQNPFGNYFDASLVWGPIPGRMWYGGFRIKI